MHAVPPAVIDRIDAALQVTRDKRGPVLVGIAGPVAVGKTTFASALALATGGATRTTDGFLLSNAQLEARGILDQKGFPQSYDNQRLIEFLQQIRISDTVTGLSRYSHETFDVEPDPQPFHRDRIVIIEGVNALQPTIAAQLDVRLYLDADEPDVIDWYTDRFRKLTRLAQQSGTGFYTRFASLSSEDLTAMAHAVWHAINAPNLHQHIAPTKAHADVVIRLSADHTLTVE